MFMNRKLELNNWGQNHPPPAPKQFNKRNYNGVSNFLFNRSPCFFDEKRLNVKNYRVAERGSLKRYHDARKNQILGDCTNRRPLSEVTANSICRIGIDIDALRRRQVDANRARYDINCRLKSYLQNHSLSKAQEHDTQATIMPCSREDVIPSLKRKLRLIETYKERRLEELFNMRRRDDEAKKEANRAHSMKRKLERVKKSLNEDKLPCKQLCRNTMVENMTNRNESDVREEAWLSSFLDRLSNRT